MRIKVQHDNREVGPFEIAELFQALEEGDVCAMDWCWDHDNFRGIRTVHQLLTDESRAPKHESRSTAVKKHLQGEASAERVRKALAEDPQLKADLEDYKKRLDRELFQQRNKLEEDKNLFAQLRADFYEERSRLEADLGHAREDLERSRTALGEGKKRLAEQHKRHAKAVAEYEARRKRNAAELAKEQERLAGEWDRLAELEKRVVKDKAELDETRQRLADEAEEGREKLALELRRVRETAKRLSEDKTEIEDQRRRTVAHLQEVKDRLDEERKALDDRDHALAEQRAEIEANRKRVAAELATERRRVEEERRQLLQLHRELSATASLASSQGGYTGPRDEKYYGRLLGLSGKVSYDEIKRAYRFSAFRCHPDKVQDLHPDFVTMANGKLRELNEALEFFRARYEKRRRTEE